MEFSLIWPTEPSERRVQPVVLFLQGNISGFFAAFGRAVAAQGVGVVRVNFNGGDAALWPLPGALDFVDDVDAWPAFLTEVMRSRQVTDVVLCGDCRPRHREAILLAHAEGVRVHVVEEGYLRPGWITFERNGVNGFSRLPRTAEAVRVAAQGLPDSKPLQSFRSEFGRRARVVTLYHAARLARAWRFRRYRFHTKTDPALELAGWTRRLLTRRRELRRGRRLLDAMPAQTPLYLFPMQLDTDFQVRVHSPFAGMAEALALAIESFARYAPLEARLIVKSHPLEGRLVSWRREVETLARRYGLGERLVYMEHDDIYAVIRRASGVVTVNSTVGALALELGRPVKVLGVAVYDVDGLTFQGPLEAFWAGAPPPDPDLFEAFRRMLVDRCLVPGGFFSTAAIEAAAAGALRRLEAAWATTPREA